MPNLRKFLCSCFGFCSVIYLFAACSAVASMFHTQSAFHSLPSTHSSALHSPFVTATLLSLGELIRAMPLVLGILYGMAWWKVRRGKASGRGWAIAASLVMVLQSIPFFIVPFLVRAQVPLSRVRAELILAVFMLALGIAGLVAFARRDAMSKPVIAAKPQRIAGDGTSRVLDGILWVIGFAGYFGAMYLWRRWGAAHQLPTSYIGLLRLLILVLIITVVHELGHAATGLAVGMKLRAFIVGPFQWRIRDGRWTFKFLPAKFLSAGGATAMVPANPRQSLWSQICMIAAGPVVNLLTGAAAMYAALNSKGQPYEQYWGILAYFSTISLIAFASNLIPMQSGAAYSDGGRIYQLLKGGPLADLYRIFNLVGATLVTPLRPRDYDIDAIQRAEISFTQGMQAFLLRLFASSYFLDHRMFPQAADAVADAERIQQESALDIPAELCLSLVYRVAFLRRDAAGARKWWERMEAKKLSHFGVDYWLAQSALFWSEGRLQDAREAWNKGNALAQKLPAAGDDEFDRYRCSLLHDCIQSTEVEAAS